MRGLQQRSCIPTVVFLDPDQDADLKFTFKPVGDDELDFIAVSYELLLFLLFGAVGFINAMATALHLVMLACFFNHI